MIYQTVTVERPDLLLPCGIRADSLKSAPLRRELERLAVPGINANMGKHDLLNAFEAAVLARAEALRRDDHRTKHPKTVTPAEMRAAAEGMQQATGAEHG